MPGHNLSFPPNDLCKWPSGKLLIAAIEFDPCEFISGTQIPFRISRKTNTAVDVPALYIFRLPTSVRFLFSIFFRSEGRRFRTISKIRFHEADGKFPMPLTSPDCSAKTARTAAGLPFFFSPTKHQSSD